MSDSCSGNCNTCSHHQEEQEALCNLRRNLFGVKHSIVVLSGKGGVGKSTVSVNLAAALALAGHQVGLLDVDVHGPSIPTMMGLSGAVVQATDDNKILPIDAGGIKVLSVGLVIRDPDEPIIWRGPMKIGVIQQFLSQTEWGSLDYLIIDVPPGTGDEPLTICQSLPRPMGAIVVTTPQMVAAADVSKSVNFCKKLEFPVLGLVENMSGFICPHCGETIQIFPTGGTDKLALQYGVPILGRIPVSPNIAASGDAGEPFMKSFRNSPAAEAFGTVVAAIENAAAEAEKNAAAALPENAPLS